MTHPRTPKAQESRLRERRAVHLVDMENLAGGSSLTAERVATIWLAYHAYGTSVLAGDRVVIGTGPTAAPPTWYGLPQSCTRVLGHGKDGGENAIIASLDLDLIARRYGRLVIASGDNRFIAVAQRARELGMRVELVIGAGTPARRLLETCPRRTWLKFPGALTLEGYRNERETDVILRRLERAFA